MTVSAWIKLVDVWSGHVIYILKQRTETPKLTGNSCLFLYRKYCGKEKLGNNREFHISRQALKKYISCSHDKSARILSEIIQFHVCML
jgi:hypothetical protein